MTKESRAGMTIEDCLRREDREWVRKVKGHKKTPPFQEGFSIFPTKLLGVLPLDGGFTAAFAIAAQVLLQTL